MTSFGGQKAPVFPTGNSTRMQRSVRLGRSAPHNTSLRTRRNEVSRQAFNSSTIPNDRETKVYCLGGTAIREQRLSLPSCLSSPYGLWSSHVSLTRCHLLSVSSSREINTKKYRISSYRSAFSVEHKNGLAQPRRTLLSIKLPPVYCSLVVLVLE